MKKCLLWALALSLVLLAGCGAKTQKAGEDTAHPYTWKEQRDGTILLTINGENEDGYEWQVDGISGGMVKVEKLESTGDKANFSLTALGQGGTLVIFSSERDGAIQDRRFQIVMELTADENGKLTVTAFNQSELPGISAAGADTEHPYSWGAEADGALKVYITSETNDFWSVREVDEKHVQVVGPSYDAGGCAFVLTGQADGETEVEFYESARGYSIRLKLAVEDGLLSVTDHQEAAAELEQTEATKETVAALVGEVTLPEDLYILRLELLSWNNGETDDTARISFLLNNRQWSWLLSKSVSADTMFTDVGGQKEYAAKRTIGGRSVTIASDPEGAVAYWKDGAGRNCCLSSTGTLTDDEVADVVKTLIGGGNG